MRLAVVDQIVPSGGGGRLLTRLVPALVAHRDVGEVILVVPDDRTGFLTENGVDLSTVTLRTIAGSPDRANPLRIRGLRRLVDAAEVATAGVRPRRSTRRHQRRHDALARAIADTDAALFTWPFFLEPFPAPARRFAVVHDLNLMHWFGDGYGDPPVLDRFEQLLRAFVDGATLVCGTQFVADEIHTHLGVPADRIGVVPWSTFADPARLDRSRVHEVVARYGITRPYLMCPANPMPHKNLSQAIAAFARLRAAGHDLDLVMTGIHAGWSGVAANGYVRHATPGVRPDVHGLGYVPATDVDALVAGAAVVVAPSVFEAGSGPALDAWALGAPVAFSDIPPFREHLAELGTEAATFDPCDAADMAEVIGGLLADPERRARMVAASKTAIDAYPWAAVADRLVPILLGGAA